LPAKPELARKFHDVPRGPWGPPGRDRGPNARPSGCAERRGSRRAADLGGGAL